MEHIANKLRSKSEKLPVLFLIFNREATALQSLESIKNYNPQKLYIAADGPRKEKTGESLICEHTRNAVLQALNWDCEIKMLFRDHNLGCANAIYGAITWFFENEEYGIIIEDDCLIHADFYRLCEQLLPFYKNEEKIMLITAQNNTPNLKLANQIVFTNISWIWGWASWRRAWAKMDMNMRQWPRYKSRRLISNYGILYGIYKYYRWNKYYANIQQANTWDSQWNFSVLANQGLCLSSNVNLSKNIGIELGGAHYQSGDKDIFAHIPFGSVSWPLELPNKLELTKEKLSVERKEFIRVRLLGLKKKIKRLFSPAKKMT
jgi:hypothetical protein